MTPKTDQKPLTGWVAICHRKRHHDKIVRVWVEVPGGEINVSRHASRMTIPEALAVISRLKRTAQRLAGRPVAWRETSTMRDVKRAYQRSGWSTRKLVWP